MLSGRRDEVVPQSHMHALWDAVARRGEMVSRRDGTKETEGSSSPSASNVGLGVHVDYKVGLERARFVEFKQGYHSESPSHAIEASNTQLIKM